MRSEQKIIQSCRQTGERAERLLEWLDQCRVMLKAQNKALRTEVLSLTNELSTIVEAVEQPPTAGLIGPWGSDRAELIGALLGDAPSAPDDDARLRLGRDRVLAALPGDADGGTGARVRFVDADKAESPYRFPVRLLLLGQLDLVEILASAYLVHVPPRRQRVASATDIATLLSAKSGDVVAHAFSGMSRRDVDTLRDTLHAVAPDNRAMSELAAGGYWELFGNLIAHLTEPARRKAFALLWGEDPELTALFDRLSDTIELLGFSGESFIGLDGLIGRDPTSGWMVRHPDSVIATATLVSSYDKPDKTIRVSSRHGRAADVERFALAALADEVRLPIDARALPLLENAELLMLPAPAPVTLWPRGGAPAAGRRPERTGLTALEAIEIFAAQKACHQIDKSVRRHGVTSLLVATDRNEAVDGAEIDAGTARSIADWVEQSQGDTPHVRERRRTGIAVLVAERTTQTGQSLVPTAPADPLLAASTGGDTRLTATVEAVLDGNKDWVAEWTPNRPFKNVFTWRPAVPVTPAQATHGARGRGSADILIFDRSRAGDGGAPPAPRLDPTATYDLANLMHSLTQATTSTIHLHQLSARLTELRRALSGRFIRLHHSNDPTSVVEWRRQLCHVACNRLQQAAQHGGVGHLQQALMFHEGDARAVLARLKASTEARNTRGDAPDLRTFEAARIVEACLEAWICGMRQSTRSSALMRKVMVPAPVVSNMIDELAIGALRIGLQDSLTEAVRRIQLNAPRAVDCETSVAALMERGINTYLEALDPAARSLRGGARDHNYGLGALGGPAAGRGRSVAHAGASDPSSPGRNGRPGSASGTDEWTELFADLIEANILGASLLGGSSHLNRELGDVLGAIAAGSFEGAQ